MEVILNGGLSSIEGRSRGSLAFDEGGYDRFNGRSRRASLALFSSWVTGRSRRGSSTIKSG
ncbi:hypothetical protein Csa_005111 [Cucumis sativus]|uniref:Uncharacterized protein n=1 Tax=Cucumis sativus TaxID=3659 RepID=A0A0A0KDL2_CUCSA|nr:hypothetical protein Csa_005111 [Cucumis sativus]